jgi:hypothetical protein
MANFEPSDRVVWIRAVPDPSKKGIQGTVVAIDDDALGGQFPLYEVQFEFGKATLYGTQIEAAPLHR